MQYDSKIHDAILNLKCNYLSIKGQRDFARGAMGDYLGRAKALQRKIGGRPDTKDGPRPAPLTGKQKVWAERKLADLMVQTGNYKMLARAASEEMRSALLAYGFARNRTFERMQPGSQQVNDSKGIADRLTDAGIKTDKTTICEWVSSRTVFPSEFKGAEKLRQRVEQAEKALIAA